MQEALPQLPQRKTLLSIVIGVFAITFIIYFASLKNTFVAWDDNFLIVSNSLIRGFSLQHIRDAFTSFDPELYDPLTMLTYMSDFAIGGQNAFMFHFTNLILHALNAICVAWLLFLLSRKQWIGIVGGLLFALHPLNVEAVAWAAARKDVLSTFFFLLSLIGYLYWRKGDRKKFYILSIIAFVLGLLSKVMVLTLPIVLVLIDYLEERQWSWKMLIEKIPYFLLSTFFGLLALYGKRGVTVESTTLEKVLMAAKSTVYYLEKLIWPTHLSVLYPYTKAITISSPDFYVPLVIILCIICIVFIFRRYRFLTFGIAFYLLTLIPTFLNFAKGGKFYFASDRYAYIPEIGIFFLILMLIDQWWEKNPKPLIKQACIVSFIGILGVFSFLTYKQSLTWRNTETLFLQTLTYYPEAIDARLNLGYVYRESGLFNKALDQFNETLRIDPKNALAHTNIGVVYEKQNKMDEAVAEFKKAMELDPKQQDSFFALGLLYEQQGKLDEALEMYKKVQTIAPGFAQIYNNLGSVYIRKNEWDLAEASFRQTLVINPYNPDAHYNLAVIDQKNGKLTEAAQEYETTLSLEGDTIATLQTLAGIYADQNQTDETVRTLKRMIALDPQNSFALKLLDALRAHGLAE